MQLPPGDFLSSYAAILAQQGEGIGAEQLDRPGPRRREHAHRGRADHHAPGDQAERVLFGHRTLAEQEVSGRADGRTDPGRQAHDVETQALPELRDQREPRHG